MPTKSRGNPNWKKGVSGNPGGRPHQPKEMLEIARAESPAAFRRVCDLVQSKNEQVALAAAREVLDRAWGKPSQESTMNLRHSDKREAADWTDTELIAVLDRARENDTDNPHLPDGNETEH